jgi:hypothetical protein
MKRKSNNFATSIENKHLLHRSHVAKSWETGRPSRRMEAEVSCLREYGCTIKVHDVSVRGVVKNRIYKLSDINESVHKIISQFAHERNWKHLFALIEFFRDEK